MPPVWSLISLGLQNCGVKLNYLMFLALSEKIRGGYSYIVWVGVCRWVRESPTL